MGRGRAALGALAPAAVLLGLVALTGRVRAAPVALTALAAALPWLGLGLVLVQGLAALLSRRGGLGAAATALAWAATWGVRWTGLGADAAPAGSGVTVLTWNLQRLGFDADPARVACVAEAVGAADPDALALQEVSRRDVDLLEARLGLRCVWEDYRGTGQAGRGGLAACAGGAWWRLGEGGPRRTLDPVDWYAAFAELEGPGGAVFNLVSVHLPPYGSADWADRSVARAQADQARALGALADRLRDPTVLAGDFNSPPDAAVHALLRRTLRDAWARAGWGPGATVRPRGLLPVRGDFVYVTPEVGIASARLGPAGCADHRPVIVRLALP